MLSLSNVAQFRPTESRFSLSKNLLASVVSTLSEGKVGQDLDGSFLLLNNGLYQILDGDHPDNLFGFVQKRKLQKQTQHQTLPARTHEVTFLHTREAGVCCMNVLTCRISLVSILAMQSSTESFTLAVTMFAALVEISLILVSFDVFPKRAILQT